MQRDRAWYYLTQEELDRLNPPEDAEERLDWLPVGYIPRPDNRIKWFVYHLMHGLWMGYPLHKVLGYAFTNTKPSEEIQELDIEIIEISEEEKHFFETAEAMRLAIFEFAVRKETEK